MVAAVSTLGSYPRGRGCESLLRNQIMKKGRIKRMKKAYIKLSFDGIKEVKEDLRRLDALLDEVMHLVDRINGTKIELKTSLDQNQS